MTLTTCFFFTSLFPGGMCAASSSGDLWFCSELSCKLQRRPSLAADLDAVDHHSIVNMEVARMGFLRCSVSFYLEVSSR